MRSRARVAFPLVGGIKYERKSFVAADCRVIAGMPWMVQHATVCDEVIAFVLMPRVWINLSKQLRQYSLEKVLEALPCLAAAA